jgi:hypothetical protein
VCREKQAKEIKSIKRKDYGTALVIIHGKIWKENILILSRYWRFVK